MELTPVELEELVKRGAKAALVEMGLTEEDAAQDLKELVGFLDFYRKVKDEATRTATRIVITIMIVSTLVYFGGKSKLVEAVTKLISG